MPLETKRIVTVNNLVAKRNAGTVIVAPKKQLLVLKKKIALRARQELNIHIQEILQSLS